MILCIWSLGKDLIFYKASTVSTLESREEFELFARMKYEGWRKEITGALLGCGIWVGAGWVLPLQMA